MDLGGRRLRVSCPLGAGGLGWKWRHQSRLAATPSPTKSLADSRRQPPRAFLCGNAYSTSAPSISAGLGSWPIHCGRTLPYFCKADPVVDWNLDSNRLRQDFSKLGGSAAIAFSAALAAPTLVFFSAEILSETLAALIVAVFLYVTVTESNPVWPGAAIGLGMLERFNLATLAVTYLVYQCAAKKPAQAVRHVALAGLVAVAIVVPLVCA